MFNVFLEKYFDKIHLDINSNVKYIYNLPQSSWSFFVSSIFQEGILKNRLHDSKKSDFIVFIFPDKELAKQTYEEASLYISEENLYLFLDLNGIPYEWVPHDIYISGERIRTLYAIRSQKKGIIFTTIQVILKKLPSVDLWKNNLLLLKKNQKIDLKHLLQTLVGFGYRSVEKVENMGEFSLKGEILDIFPVHLDKPIRIDFF